MASRGTTPLEQIFWHFSVAIHHLQAALDHAQARAVLTPDEYHTLEAMGREICEVIDRLVAEDDDLTDAP